MIGITDPQNVDHPVTFDSTKCVNDQPDNMNTMAVDFMNKSLEQGKRKYKRTKKTRVPHTWRTHKDPFEEVWAEICTWLEEHPERTAKSLFIELQERYPGQYKDGQLRTLQRRVKEWRSKAILTFDYEWLNDEILADDKFTTKFQGKLFREADL